MNTITEQDNAVKLNIKQIIVDVEYGFAYAATDDDSENLFQVCCTDDGLIDLDNCGWDFGICWDYNSRLYGNDYYLVKKLFEQFSDFVIESGLQA